MQKVFGIPKYFYLLKYDNKISYNSSEVKRSSDFFCKIANHRPASDFFALAVDTLFLVKGRALNADLVSPPLAACPRVAGQASAPAKA